MDFYLCKSAPFPCLCSEETLSDCLVAVISGCLSLRATEGKMTVRHHGVLTLGSLSRLQMEPQPRSHSLLQVLAVSEGNVPTNLPGVAAAIFSQNFELYKIGPNGTPRVEMFICIF